MSETNCMCTVCDRREVLAQPECLKQDWQFECLKQTVSETDWVLTHKQVFHPKDFYSNIPSTKRQMYAAVSSVCKPCGTEDG